MDEQNKGEAVPYLLAAVTIVVIVVVLIAGAAR